MTAILSAARLLAAVLISGAATWPAHAADPAPTAVAAPAPAREQAIFAVTDADPARWNLTLGNIANALEGIGADKADIELVVYGPGIAMLRKDSVVADKLAAALGHGVRVAACQNSMRGFGIDAADLVPGVGVVPAGVVELIRRQHAGYAYVRS